MSIVVWAFAALGVLDVVCMLVLAFIVWREERRRKQPSRFCEQVHYIERKRAEIEAEAAARAVEHTLARRQR